MRGLKLISKDIKRCQKQIATIYGMPKHEQCDISLEGFQLQLKKLLHEKAKALPVVGATVFKPHAPRLITGAAHTSKILRELAQKACHVTIAEATKTRTAC